MPEAAERRRNATLTMWTTACGVMSPMWVSARFAMNSSEVLISCSYAFGSCKRARSRCTEQLRGVPVSWLVLADKVLVLPWLHTYERCI